MRYEPTPSEMAQSRLSDIIVTKNAWIDPKEPNVIIDEENIITITPHWKVENDRLASEAMSKINRIYLEGVVNAAFRSGVEYESLNRMLPKRKRLDVRTLREYLKSRSQIYSNCAGVDCGQTDPRPIDKTLDGLFDLLLQGLHTSNITDRQTTPE
jgi:hypothetical protein